MTEQPRKLDDFRMAKRSIGEIDAEIRSGVGPDRTDPVTAERERLEWIEAVRRIKYLNEVKEA